MQYKVGDWCVCTNLKDVNGKIGHVFQIGQVDTSYLPEEAWYHYTEETSIIGRCLQAQHFRLALPHEIPGYKPKNYKYLMKLLKKLKII